MPSRLQQFAYLLTAILLAGLPFHAFLWTWFHSFFWQESWTIVVQAWKEILVGLLAISALIKLPSLDERGWGRVKKIVNLLTLAFLLLAMLYAIFGKAEIMQKIFGLRTATIFLVAFLSIQFFDFSEAQRKNLIQIALGSASFVILFALLQKFILPADFLRYFGYSENVSSWLPGGNLPMYHLIGDTDTIRLQSTIAGPNQLGAYLLVILPLAFAQLKNSKILNYFILLGGLTTLFFTFSRSAWLGLIIMLLFGIIWHRRKNLKTSANKKILIGTILGLIVLSAVTLTQPDLKNTVLRQASTSEHLTKSREAAKLVLANPLGIGLGQTAGVSQRFLSSPPLDKKDKKNNLTPENTYLSIALETGWLGGALFLGFLVILLKNLAQRKSPLFFSLLGISVIALFLHPLEDSTTALTLFLLAGLSMNFMPKQNQ